MILLISHIDICLAIKSERECLIKVTRIGTWLTTATRYTLVVGRSGANDSMLFVVGNIKITIGVKNDVCWIVQHESVGSSISCHCCSVQLPQLETLNAIVACIGHVQVEVDIHKNTPWTVELIGRRSLHMSSCNCCRDIVVEAERERNDGAVVAYRTVQSVVQVDEQSIAIAVESSD